MIDTNGPAGEESKVQVNEVLKAKAESKDSAAFSCRVYGGMISVLAVISYFGDAPKPLKIHDTNLSQVLTQQFNVAQKAKNDFVTLNVADIDSAVNEKTARDVESQTESHRNRTLVTLGLSLAFLGGSIVQRRQAAALNKQAIQPQVS